MKEAHLRTETQMEEQINTLKAEKQALERMNTEFSQYDHEMVRRQIRNPKPALNLRGVGLASNAAPTESTQRCEVADLPMIMNDANREGHSSSITTSVDALQTLQDCALEIIEEEEKEEEPQTDEASTCLKYFWAK